MVKNDTHLVVRRRRGDGCDHLWLGYDEIDNATGKATGRIVRGWTFDENNDVINFYFDKPPEVTAARASDKAATEHVTEVIPVHQTDDVIPANVEPFHPFSHIPFLNEDIVDAPAINPDISQADVRYVVTFDWHYGSERMSFDNRADVMPWRKVTEARFGFLNLKNWKIAKEIVLTEDIPWDE